MKITPLHDRVVVIRAEEEEKTAGGIILPDTAKEKPRKGKVIAVGAGRMDEDGKRIPLDVKEGDRKALEPCYDIRTGTYLALQEWMSSVMKKYDKLSAT